MTNSSGNLRRLAGRVIPIVFYVLIGVFAWVYLTKINWDGLKGLNPNWWWIAASAAAAIVLRYWYASIWMFLMRRLGAHTKGHHSELYAVYAKSWLGRYLPGGVTWIVGKIYFASKLGLSKTKLGISSFLEGALQIIALMISATLILAFDPLVQNFGSQWVVLLVAASIVGLISVYPPLFNRLTAFMYLKVRKEKLDAASLPSTATIGYGVGAFLFSSLLNGLAFYFLVLAVAPEIGLGKIFYVIGCASLANALSMLAVFAPAGLGVREGVQLAMLAVIINPGLAVVVTVLDRILSIAMDTVFWGSAITQNRLVAAKTARIEKKL